MVRMKFSLSCIYISILIVMASLTIRLFLPYAQATLTGLTWGITKTECDQAFPFTDKDVRVFSPADDNKYENRIMNYIIAIDTDLKSDIVIYRTLKAPVKDFLFVKNRLYSILEDYGNISSSEEQRTIDSLKKTYGEPSVLRDKNVVIYSYQDANTKVIMISSQKGNAYNCKAYYYASKLFKMLMTK